MKNKYHDYRKSYEKHQLSKESTPDNPFELFAIWFKDAEAAPETDEVNVMSLSTIGLDGFPKTRIVLLKEYDSEGFVFFTNYTSEKGRSIEQHPEVCLSFFWHPLERQIIIKGNAGRTSEEDSMHYFQSRPRGSQLGAWASQQSSVIPSRAVLEERLMALEKEYEGKLVPKPPFWGGFRVIPEEFEFWQGRPNRLHDRISYKRGSDRVWKKQRLAP